jgi:rhamnosyltransferase
MHTPLAAAVIAYNPPPELLQNILSYYPAVDKVIVVDNSDTAGNPTLQQLAAMDKVLLLDNKGNQGIGAALNLAAGTAVQLGYQWLLTMDQDSSFAAPQLASYLQCWQTLQQPNTGTLGINYLKNNQGTSTGCQPLAADSVITSGSLVNLAACMQVGGFNEALFIDGVDDEFCFKLQLQGYKVWLLPNISLVHQLGKDVWVRNWLIGPRVQRNIHPPVRMYYMVRNYLYLIKKYQPHFPAKAAEYKRTLHNKIKNNVLYNRQRVQVIKYILQGVADFKKEQLGKHRPA